MSKIRKVILLSFFCISTLVFSGCSGCRRETEYRHVQYCPADKEYVDSIGFYVSAEGYPDMPIGPTEDYAKVIGNIFEKEVK